MITDDRYKVRVLHEHTGCRGEPCFEWDGQIGLFLNGDPVWRSAIGTKGGSGHRWHPIGCNTPDCKFSALVRDQWIEQMVSEVLS